jgi:hypothetical protein
MGVRPRAAQTYMVISSQPKVFLELRIAELWVCCSGPARHKLIPHPGGRPMLPPDQVAREPVAELILDRLVVVIGHPNAVRKYTVFVVHDLRTLAVFPGIGRALVVVSVA